MQKRILPWSLKGVSLAARDAARTAARCEGIPVGVWLTRVIRETSIAERAGATPAEIGPSRNSIERAAARLTGGGEPHGQ